MANGRSIRIADSGLSPARKIVKIISQVAIELREAKKPLVVERRPITASAIEPRPTKGDKNELSRVVFQEKSGMKAVLIFSMNWLKVKPGASRSCGTMTGLTKAATTSAARPTSIINIVKISGKVGRVFIVKRRCGCARAKITIKAAK